MIKLLKSLISIDSISGNEKQIADFVEQQLKRCEGNTQRIGNCIVWRSNWKSNRKTIALGSHLDTVPYTEANWKMTKPCSPLEKDGKVYGRGSCDMKAGASIILDLIIRKSIGNAYNVMAFFYDKEELGMPNGVSTLIEKGFFKDVDLCIIPEPTECTINYGVFGNLNARLIADGIAVHSSKPKTGRNALYEILPVIEEIRNFPVKTIAGVEEAITVNKINGGNAINVLPDKVIALLDYRFDPKLNSNAAIKILKSFERKHVTTELIGCFPGVIHNPETHPLLSYIIELVGNSSIVPFWSDIGQLGVAGITAINFGPGSIDQAHRADEFVSIEDMDYVRNILLNFLNSKITY